jgi:hypothetical protein
MATLTKVLARTAFETEYGLLYGTPETPATVTVVTNVVVVNTGANLGNFSLMLDGVDLFKNTPINANSTISIDLKQVVEVDIVGAASSVDIKVHLSGVEIS